MAWRRPVTRRARRSPPWSGSQTRCCRTASATNGRRSRIQQLRAGSTAMFAFSLAVVFVFLVLAAQFESLTLPLAIIMIVPMCLVGVDHRRRDARARQQHPHAGRLRRAHRPRGEERHPDRGIRQAARGSGPRPLRRRGRGGQAAAAADPDDVVRLHLRRRAAGVGARARAPNCVRRWARRCSPA